MSDIHQGSSNVWFIPVPSISRLIVTDMQGQGKWEEGREGGGGKGEEGRGRREGGGGKGEEGRGRREGGGGKGEEGRGRRKGGGGKGEEGRKGEEAWKMNVSNLHEGKKKQRLQITLDPMKKQHI